MTNRDKTPSQSGATFLAMHEIVQKARQKLNHDAWDYIVGGTETETTLRRNRASIDALAFRPRVLRDVSQIDLSTNFLGHTLRLPVLLAPVGSLELFSENAAADAARAAGEFGVAHMLSSICAPGLEAVAKTAPDTQRLFQLYVHGDPAWVDDVAARAVNEGYSAFCLTVDSAVYSRRERDLAKRNIRRSVVPGREHQATLTWKDVDRLKSNLSIPLILKGIMTAEDAELAVEHGVDMIYVSNHGGRQLDHGLGAMDALPEIVKIVNGRAKIIIDGGFNRGADVVKAIACGADMVGLGRMQCYGLAADGIAGVVRMLELLEIEIRICMGLLGVTSFAELNSRHLQSAPALGNSDVLSAFPLLSLDEKSFY